MAITVIKTETFEMHQGHRGYREVRKRCAFSTTDASGTVDITPLMRVEHVDITPGGTPASDEIISGPIIDPTTGVVTVASNAVTITRTGASKTSGQVFWLRLQGR